MTLSLDLTRARRTRPELAEVVEAIRDAPLDEPETDWMEWKRTLDLEASAEHRFEAARHILGFGNRDPASAAPYCEGTAYLVLGVEPGRIYGVPAWDPADIDNWLSKYVAPGAPRWRADSSRVDGHQVLVITIEAPAQGDPIRTLQHGFDRHPAGRIFVRRSGKTEEASPSEIAQLESRLVRGVSDIELGLHAEVAGERLTPLNLPDEAFERWRDAEESALLKTLPQARSTMEPWVPRVSLESRTQDQFRAEVATYLAESKQRWLAIAHREAMKARLAVVCLTICNPTSDNFPGTQLEVFLPSDVRAFVDEDDPEVQFDPPPRPEDFGGSTVLRSLGKYGPPPAIPSRDEITSDSDAATVRFLPVAVRPGGRHPLPDLHLGIPPNMAGQDLTLGWRATSTGATGWAEGEITLPVSDSSAHLTEAGGGT